MTAVFFGTVAYADDIADCYANAEASHSGRSITVSQGQTTVLTSSDLASVFDKVAELHTDPTLSLQYNLAGRNALRDAMSCVFSDSTVTLSAVYLNQTDQNLNVRQDTVRIENSSGQLQSLLEFDRVDMAGCTAGPALFFTETSTTQGGHSLSLIVSAYGANDFSGDISLANADQCSKNEIDPCTGSCAGECDEDGNIYCACLSGSGECGEATPGSIDVEGFSVIVVTM